MRTLGAVSALIWLLLAAALVGGELLLGDLSLLMLGGGALAAGGATAAGAPTWAAAVVFAAVTALLLIAVRPALRRRMAAPDRAAELEGGTRSLAGRTGVVVEDVDGLSGLVRVDGALWSARALVVGAAFGPGDRVTVVHVDGNTAVVDQEVH